MLQVTTSSEDNSNESESYPDDIDCVEWLREVGLEQYDEVFRVNFTRGGSLLSRKRLAQVRLKDLPMMNITNYAHQKIIMEHIRHTLAFTFHSPERKTRVAEAAFLRESSIEDIGDEDDMDMNDA